MVRSPPRFGAPLHLALGLGAAVALTALLCGWPYWREEPVAAAVTLPCCSGFAVAAGLMAAGRHGRRAAFLFVLAAFAWAVTWAAARNAGPLPLISVFAQSTCYFTVGTGILLYPSGRLERRTERGWTALAALVLFGGQLALCVTSLPQWNGFAPSVTWPSPFTDRLLFEHVLRTLTVAHALVIGFMLVLLALRLPRVRRLERVPAVPMTLAAAAVAVIAGTSQQALLAADVRLDDVLRVYLIQGSSALALPLALLAAGLRARLAELAAAERMLHLTAPVSIGKVRDALRDVLHDDTLDLWFWLPQDGLHVDVAGRPADLTAPPAPGRGRRQVRTDTGDLLATVEADLAPTGQASLLEAALVAGAHALETARLQATAQAHLERARTAREDLIRLQAAERERLAGDLRHSAEQRLHDLSTLLEALEEAAADPAVRARARDCRHELAEAVAEIGRLARGVHPSALTEAGLGPALRQVAARTTLPVHLDLPGDRFPPGLESTLYFALCEALANAVKHAGAGAVRLSVRTAPGRVLARVEDDGVGGTRPIPGTGGLTGIIDRVRALRGDVVIDSPPGHGTAVTISIPHE